MASSPLIVRDLAADDLDQVLDVRTRSFGPLGEADRPGWYDFHQKLIPQRRCLVVHDGDRVVAAARAWDMRQWWGGRSLPMAGIAGVVVAPEHRGRGVGSLLMHALLERTVELGDAVSVLYPATLAVYRGLGWELGGAQHRVSVRTELLRRLGGREVPVRRAVPDDAEAIAAIAGTVHRQARASGPLDNAASEVRESLEDDDVFGYVADDGYCLYGWHPGGALLVQELVAGSEQTARALWSVVGSGSSTAKTVHAYVDPRDPLVLLLGEGPELGVEMNRWMLRVLDLEAAVSGRGFPAGVSAQVPLVVEDAQVPRCSGSWLLRVSDGVGEVTEGGGDGVRLGANGLAALFAGGGMASLRLAGLASGGSPEQDALLDTAFAGEPYLLDYF